MIKHLLAVIIVLIFAGNSSAYQPETIIKLETETGTIEGTMLLPEEKNKIPVALIIAGSGPTDRNGNIPGMTNNSLKMLADGMQQHGIATLRYDKRGIGKSGLAGMREDDLRIEHYISDARNWIELLRKDLHFSDLIVVGHSEGALIGMVASQGNRVDKFISIAGPGLSADNILKEQLQSQPREILDISLPIIESLVRGEIVKNINPMLYSLFRPSVQPYMISWFKYDPSSEIAKLNMPVLIVQGATDIQVSEMNARILAESNQQAEMKIISGMNHILKDAESDKMKNIETYNLPEMPINGELIELIAGFIN